MRNWEQIDALRLYVSTKEGGRVITRNEDWVDGSIQGLGNHFKKSKDRMIYAAGSNIGNIRKKKSNTI